MGQQQNTGMSDVASLGMLDPSQGTEDDASPLRRIFGMMALKNLSGGGEDESGGEVGTRAIDQGTAKPSSPSADNMSEMVRGGGATPPGFDPATQMQTEFPATAGKAAAYEKLQKAQSGLEETRAKEARPGSILKHALIGMIPAFGQLYNAASIGNERRQRADVENTREQYQFEGGQEERQREASMKERQVMTNIEYTRQMKNLMATIANKKANIQQNIGEGRNEANAAGKGYDLNIGPNGSETVTPRKAADLSELQRASLEYQQANESYKKAQTAAIPEQIEIAKRRVDVSLAELQRQIQHQNFSEDMARENMDFRETGPTTQTRNAGQAAGPLLDMNPKIKQEISDFKNQLGPLKSRWKEVWATGAGLAGENLTRYKKIQDDLEYYASQTALAHARGRMPTPIFTQFQKMYALAKQDPANIEAALDVGSDWMKEAQKNAQWDGKLATPNNMQTPTAPSKLQKRAPAGGGAARTVTRGKDGKLVFAP